MVPADFPPHGKVYLVGAGPGAPGLISLRGLECLERADLILADYRVSSELMAHVSSEAEWVALEGTAPGEPCKQEEIDRRMIEAAREGKTVVRLKVGDPMIFARGCEEIEKLQHHGIPYEIVPGVTAGLAVAALAALPLTHREEASAVALVAGRESDRKQGPPLDYARLADFPGVLVFYMAETNAERWSGALLAAGKPAETPVALVCRCSLPDQRVERTTLGEVAQRLADPAMARPVMAVVGSVARAEAAPLDWFARRPLYGRSVLITRPAHQAASLSRPLRELGAKVLFQPAIQIGGPPDPTALQTVIDRLASFQWIVFSSANGVEAFLDALLERDDLRRLSGCRLAAIGPGTARRLKDYHLRADVIPDQYRAESLAESLAGGAAGVRFLLIRASRGREVLAEQLRQAGGEVEQIVVYTSTDVMQPDPAIARRLEEGSIDWITVTSSAIASSLVRLFGPALGKASLATISPITSQTLRRAGFEPSAEASRYTMDGLVEAILRAEGKG